MLIESESLKKSIKSLELEGKDIIDRALNKGLDSAISIIECYEELAVKKEEPCKK